MVLCKTALKFKGQIVATALRLVNQTGSYHDAQNMCWPHWAITATGMQLRSAEKRALPCDHKIRSTGQDGKISL